MLITYHSKKLQTPPLKTFKLDSYLLIEGTADYPDAIADHPDFALLRYLGVIEVENEENQATRAETTEKTTKGTSRRPEKVASNE